MPHTKYTRLPRVLPAKQMTVAIYDYVTIQIRSVYALILTIGLFRIRSPLLPKSRLVSFPPLINMLNSSGSLLPIRGHVRFFIFT